MIFIITENERLEIDKYFSRPSTYVRFLTYSEVKSKTFSGSRSTLRRNLCTNSSWIGWCFIAALELKFWWQNLRCCRQESPYLNSPTDTSQRALKTDLYRQKNPWLWGRTYSLITGITGRSSYLVDLFSRRSSAILRLLITTMWFPNALA